MIWLFLWFASWRAASFPGTKVPFCLMMYWLEVGAGAPSYPQTSKDHFRRVYYEAIDLIVSAIYQESFISYAQMETLLVEAATGDHYEAEFKFLEASYREDVDTGALPGHATEYFGSYVIGEDGCQCVLTKSCWRCQSFQNQKRS